LSQCSVARWRFDNELTFGLTTNFASVLNNALTIVFSDHDFL